MRLLSRKDSLNYTRSVVVFCAIWFIFLSALAPSSYGASVDWDFVLLQAVKASVVDVGSARQALENGANPYATDSGKVRISAFRWLCIRTIEIQYGKVKEDDLVEILNLMIRKGWKLNAADEDEVFLPVSSGSTKFVELLLQQGLNPNLRVEGKSLIEIAQQYDKSRMIDLLVSHGAKRLDPYQANVLRFMQAAADHDIIAMATCMEGGLHADVEDQFGHIALVQALRYGIHTKTDYEAIRYLLDRGADPNHQGESDFKGWGKVPALHMAVFLTSSVFKIEAEGKVGRYPDAPRYARSVLQDLLTAGAYVSGVSEAGQTSLHVAAEWNNIVAAKMLIAAGAKISPRDNAGKTPLDYAQSGDMINLLKQYGARE